MKTTINGVELTFDIFEAANAEKFQTETNKIINVSETLKNQADLGKIIRIQCKNIFNFIDVLFGKDVHKQIFGESVNLKECCRVYNEINTAIISDKEDIKNMMSNSK